MCRAIADTDQPLRAKAWISTSASTSRLSLEFYVRDIERVLGSPEDDSTNAFTARMLLLLESQPIYDELLYGSLLERIIGFYYRDFRSAGWHTCLASTMTCG